jgi:RNA polymerase sigma-70 factor (ECF subfamily)
VAGITNVGRPDSGEASVQAELVARARGGDREAFAVLAGGAVDRLHAVARLILRDADLAQDAAQEALVRAWRDLPTLRDASRFDAWLYRVVVRACADVGRDRRRWRAEVVVLPREPAEEDRGGQVADRDLLERGLRRLTDGQRTILVMSFYVGLTPTELADVLEIPVGTAKSRLHYAIAALRAALDADGRGNDGALGKERTA